MPCILIVDDHQLIRLAVKNLLEEEFPELNVEGVGTLAQALAFLEDHGEVDLILMDLSLPDVSAMDGLSGVKSRYPSIPVAIISGTEDNAAIDAALASGADGYVPKSADSQVLANAVSLLLKGEVYLPRKYLMTRSGWSPMASGVPKNYTLTARQTEVLTLMCAGLSNKEIAREMNLSDSTIKTHVSAILKELNIASRTKAIVRANELGLVS